MFKTNKSKYIGGAIGLVASLALGGCATASSFDGYVHAECAPTTTDANGNKVTHCSSTEMPVPTQTVTVTADPGTTTSPTATTPAADANTPKNIALDPAYSTDLEHTARFVWDAVPNATIYRHYIDGVAIPNEDDNTNSETVRGLQPGTNYKFVVGAFVNGVEYKSAPFDFKTAGTAAVPVVTKVNDSSFTYTGTWQTSTGTAMYNGDNHFTNVTNNMWTYSFMGTKAQLYGQKSDGLGILAVSIDNGPEQMVDPYTSAARTEQNLLYTSPDLTNGTHTIKVRVTGTKNTASSGAYAAADRLDVTSLTSGETPSPTPTPTTPPASGGTFSFAAVGDMNPDSNSSTTSASAKNANSIKAALADGTIQNFLGLGDFQYSIGYCSNLVNYWNKLWGPEITAKTYWMAGPNHDVQPGRNDDLGKFMNGECAGSTQKSATNQLLNKRQSAMEWYSFDRGNWHFLVAPTAAWYYNSSRAQAMTSEMDADLKAAKASGKHLAVMYHDPYFTSNTDTHTRYSPVKPWIDMWSDNKVKLLFSGSQHNYERSCPVNKLDQCVTDGMQQFQVSTGGKDPLRAFTSSPGYIQKRFSDTYGHLRMTLKDDGSYSWNFVPVSGGMQTDSGTRAP